MNTSAGSHRLEEGKSLRHDAIPDASVSCAACNSGGQGCAEDQLDKPICPH
jgi:hypothetical protein